MSRRFQTRANRGVPGQQPKTEEDAGLRPLRHGSRRSVYEPRALMTPAAAVSTPNRLHGT